VVADVDVLVESNLSGHGSATMVFAREQFQFFQNGSSERIFYIACDASLAATSHDEDALGCEPNAAPKSSPNSPIHHVTIHGNTAFHAPGGGTVVVPNLGATGLSSWETL